MVMMCSMCETMDDNTGNGLIPHKEQRTTSQDTENVSIVATVCGKVVQLDLS